jgi:hypothetical protein
MSPPHVNQSLLKEDTMTIQATKKLQDFMNDMIHMLKYYNMAEDEHTLCSKINHTPYARGEFYFPEKILKKLIEER